MNKQLTHLAGIITFTGQVATAIRMYSAYNQSGDNLEQFAPEDLMYLSDALVSLEFLGEFLAAGNSAKVVSYCDSIALTLGKYIDLPAFERNPHVNLRAAISHLEGLKAQVSGQPAK